MGASYSGIVRPEHADHLRLSGYCGTGTNRALAEAGVLEILPVPYSRLGALIRQRRIRCDVAMVQVSPPNARGEYSLGLGVEYLAAALETARAVIAEVNSLVPWTHTAPLLRRSDFAMIAETSRPPVSVPCRSGDLERAIAEHAAAWIPEGATVECGIGNLPNAVLAALRSRRDIAVHTGAIPDAAILFNRLKCAGGGLFGTQALFDWAGRNADLRLHSSDYTHGAATLSRIDRFVAVNSAVEVDFSGQVNGEVARGVYVGAVGGALDFIRAANASPGGVSIIALPAARIVPRLSGPVSIPRGEAGIIVSELGSADLRGCSVKERERRLRTIAAA